MLKQNTKAPILGISRHRLLSDGSGVRTLVGFYGCPLSCNYCLNPECHRIPSKYSFFTVQDLLDEVISDHIYFMATGGGITFGGGEPLIYADFIADFIMAAPSGWKYFCETSLNVSNSKLITTLNLIDEFIVDIKDLSPSIYKEYSGIDIENVLSNLKLICDMKQCHKVMIRIPAIPNYNTENDISKSTEFLKDLGFSRFDYPNYITQIQQTKNVQAEAIYNGMNWGKITCEVLKWIRTEIANYHGITFIPNNCNHKFCKTGTCSVCEKELEELTKCLIDKY